MDKNENKEDILEDYIFARNNIYELLKKSNDALASMIEVVRESEHPRAFEVFSNMLKQNGELTEQLMDLQKKIKEINSPNKSVAKIEEQKAVTNNNVFVGSTADLQRMIQDMNSNKAIEIEEQDE